MFSKPTIRFALPCLGSILIAFSNLQAQSLDTPMTRMRPIGSPSAVDQYKTRAQPASARLHETAFQSPVRQTAMLQSAPTPPPLPAGPTTPLALPANPSAQPVPRPSNIVPAAGADMQPVPQPQLGSAGFTTIDNSCLVSPPSCYNPAYVHDCNTIVPQTYVAQPVASAVTVTPPPAAVAVPAVPATTTVPSARVGAPARSLFTFGQERFPVSVGQGIVGQPVAYVPGQPLRNWLRYFTP